MSIKERRALEAQQKAEKAKADAREEALKNVEPIDIIGTAKEIEAGTHAKLTRDEDGNILGVGGGKYVSKIISGKLVAAENEDGLKAIEERMKNGIEGDGLLHKTVFINGIPCDCHGRTEEELEADILAAETFAKKHANGNMTRDTDVAEQLIEAEMTKDDIEQVKVSGFDAIINYTHGFIMATNGETLADLDDIKSKLEKEDVKKFLLERAAAKLAELCCDDCDDCDCDCDDDCAYDDYGDDCGEDW